MASVCQKLPCLSTATAYRPAPAESQWQHPGRMRRYDGGSLQGHSVNAAGWCGVWVGVGVVGVGVPSVGRRSVLLSTEDCTHMGYPMLVGRDQGSGEVAKRTERRRHTDEERERSLCDRGLKKSVRCEVVSCFDHVLTVCGCTSAPHTPPIGPGRTGSAGRTQAMSNRYVGEEQTHARTRACVVREGGIRDEY